MSQFKYLRCWQCLLGERIEKGGQKECPPCLGKERTDTRYLRVQSSVLGCLVNHLCGKKQSFPKRQTKLFIDAGEEKGWAHTCETYDLSQNLEG